MKLVSFFLKGVLLAIFTFFVTEMIEILLYVLLFSFSFVSPLAEGLFTADLSNPWAYFIMLPAILLSIFFSRKTYSLKENIFKANSLKEVFLKGLAGLQYNLAYLLLLV
jgi:xanthine/uracil permease